MEEEKQEKKEDEEERTRTERRRKIEEDHGGRVRSVETQVDATSGEEEATRRSNR